MTPEEYAYGWERLSKLPEYTEGYNAWPKRDGNPYNADTDEHDAWAFGYEEAEYDKGGKN